MKPYKMFGMSIFTLLFFTIVHYGRFNFESNSLGFIIIDSVFSFIFPAFIFFLAWLISYKRKDEKSSLLKFYTKSLVNMVLPYFLCMIPYIIYKYGANKLELNEIIKILFAGNIANHFLYVKTVIHLLILYPLVEHLTKLNSKVSVITSLILSSLFGVFNLDKYIYTNAFNYLIYMTFGIAFSYHGREVTYFMRNKSITLINDLLEGVALVFITKFDIFSFLAPIPVILYNLAVILIMVYIFNKNKVAFYNEKKYLHDNILFNPPISVVSLFLLTKIVIEIIEKIIFSSEEVTSVAFLVICGVAYISILVINEKIRKNPNKKKGIREIEIKPQEYI